MCYTKENVLEEKIVNVEAEVEKQKADIEKQKADIRSRLISFSDAISEKTIQYVLKLFSKCGKEEYFGRTMVEEIIGLLLVSIKTSFVT